MYRDKIIQVFFYVLVCLSYGYRNRSCSIHLWPILSNFRNGTLQKEKKEEIQKNVNY